MTDWRTAARCRTEDPELFFADIEDAGNDKTKQRRKRRRIQEAKDICRDCLVTEQCLNEATRRDAREGIWGGLTPKERGHKARTSW